jgi:hypothetical protein
MTTHQPAMHVLIWREPIQTEVMSAWQSYQRPDHGMYFRKHGDPGFIHSVAHRALCGNFGAVLRNVNVLIGWGECRVEATPASEVLAMVGGLRPLTVICAERPKGDRWIISNFGAPMSFPVAGIQRAIDGFVGATFPEWRPGGAPFQPHALMFRQDVSGEELGLVERVQPTPDDTYASVADDPAVIEAGKLWDRATPSTHRDLVAAVLAAQERAGIPPEDRAPISSGEIDTFLIPIIMRMGKGDEPIVLAQIRRQLHARYGEFAEIVLGFMLRTYRHDGVAGLLQLATKAAA